MPWESSPTVVGRAAGCCLCPCPCCSRPAAQHDWPDLDCFSLKLPPSRLARLAPAAAKLLQNITDLTNVFDLYADTKAYMCAVAARLACFRPPSAHAGLPGRGKAPHVAPAAATLHQRNAPWL